MSATDKHPHPALLRQFQDLTELSEDQLELLSRTLSIQVAPKGKRLLRRGATEAYSLLLLSGTLELTAEDGKRTRIQAGSPSALHPIAHLLPRRFDVTAIEPVAYLEVDGRLIDELHEACRRRDGSRIQVEMAGSASLYPPAAETLLADRMRQDLAQDRLPLPSLPEVAVRVGHALTDELTDAHRIAAIIQTDPAMTAKIVRAANSALYMGHRRVESCADAVMRLGVGTIHKLVLSYALRELFHTQSDLLRERMQDLWRHSTRVAALCYVLARLAPHPFNAEHALLAGLVHDIGVLAILSYGERFPTLIRDAEHLDHAMLHLRAEMGAAILTQWGFGEDLVIAAREAEDWRRDPAPDPDYCDLVIVAQLHSYVGTPRMQDLPHLGEVPCFHKMDLGELTPRLSLKILEKAQEQLKRVEALLAL